ncbi:MAG: hypothetical protein IPN62_15510 [Flavobacteriales bacterium]|jgi:hypothetical protein|nr:hypothetical protein [Flavobacteriales bacterium]MBP7449442.1 hypothetical protein [Flavobacteriales bacterium]
MNLLLVSLLSLILVPRTVALPAVLHEAVVVVHVADFNNEALDRLTKEVGRSETTSLEYACVASGVLVIQFRDVSVTDRGDIIALARKLLEQAGVSSGVEVLHVEVVTRGPGRC